MEEALTTWDEPSFWPDFAVPDDASIREAFELAQADSLRHLREHGREVSGRKVTMGGIEVSIWGGSDLEELEVLFLAVRQRLLNPRGGTVVNVYDSDAQLTELRENWKARRRAMQKELRRLQWLMLRRWARRTRQMLFGE